MGERERETETETEKGIEKKRETKWKKKREKEVENMCECARGREAEIIINLKIEREMYKENFWCNFRLNEKSRQRDCWLEWKIMNKIISNKKGNYSISRWL